MVKIKVYTSKDRCDLGTVEIYVRYSAQYLVHFRCPVSDYLEKVMAPHSSTVAWKIPWMEEPGRLQSMGS